MLWVALHFPSLPPEALEPAAAWLCQFTPKVSLEPPRALLAEAQGSLRYFGGLEGLLGRLRAGLDELGYEASLATAATPRAALWHARGRREIFEDLPLEIVEDEEAVRFLRSIGLSRLGELMSLPRDGLARRCGQRLLDDLDRALGALPEPRELFEPPPRFAAMLELPGAVEHAEGVLFAARRLLVQLQGLLTARQAGVRRFRLKLFHQRKKVTEIEINLASVSRKAERFMRVLQEKLSVVSLLQPVEAIRLEAQDFAPLHERTSGMFGDAPAEDEDWAALVERLQGRLGAAAIHGLTLQPDHRPEYAWRRVEPGEWDPREFVQPGPRPLWLLEPPRRLAQERFELLAGPERIESGWWDGDDAKRDYFIARAEGNSLLWIYQDAEGWFVHGLFA
jgi:protein ImuB